MKTPSWKAEFGENNVEYGEATQEEIDETEWNVLNKDDY